MQGALDGLRVLELPGPRTQYGSLLLAGMHAEVFMIEPPGGSALRQRGPSAGTEASTSAGDQVSLPFLAHNANKKSACLDLAEQSDKATFARLLEQVDIVIEDQQPGILEARGLDPARLVEANPRLIWLALRPYGSSGPRAAWLGSDLSAQAMGGAMATTGEPGGLVYRAGASTADKMSGYTAAAAALVAVHDRENTGRGALIDVSAQEAVAGQMERGALFYAFTHIEPERAGRLYPTSAFPCGLFPAADGWVSLVALQPDHWKALVAWIDDPELADPRFMQTAARAAARDTIDRAISRWSARHTKEWLTVEGQRRRIAVAALQTPLELAQDPHLRVAGFFRTLEHPSVGRFELPGPPFNASGTPFRVETPAPEAGQHTAELLSLLAPQATVPRREAVRQENFKRRTLPLADYRILDLTWVIAGPTCTRFLADRGAEVIKVESATTGDPVRAFGPWLDGHNTAPEGGAAFALLNRHKRSITLDLKQPRGLELMFDLVKQSDVVVDNFTAGTMDRLGLSYERLREANPAIVMAQLSGFGQHGPYAKRVAYGQTLLALTGYYGTIGDVGTDPLLPGYTYTDQAAGTIAAFAILAALRHRRVTGMGQHLDLSLFQIGSSLMAEILIEALVNGTERARHGNRDDAAISHGAYRCMGNDQWCVIATWTAQQWDALANEIVALKQVPPGAIASEIDPRIEAWTRSRSPAEVMQTLQEIGVEAAAVQGPREVIEADPHLRARGFLSPFRHYPSDRDFLMEGIPYEMSSAGRAIRSGPPRLGEANDYVFRELLGLDSRQVEALTHAGVIGAGRPETQISNIAGRAR